jgi:Putative Flp pilus-assembly TadE/G-like
MPRLIRILEKRRRAMVTVVVAVSLIALIGVAALALDAGLLMDNRRRCQAGVDAAALAAASQLFTSFTAITANSPDPGGKAATAAQTVASSNGYANDGTTSIVTVNIPPKSGPFTGKLQYAEVIITYNQPRYFAAIWSSQTTPVVARAVARGFWGPTGNGIIILDPTTSDALNDTGGGSIAVTGGAAIVVDSNAATAARVTNNGSVTAAQINVTGGTSGTFNGTVTTGVLPAPDPLAYLPAPSVPQSGTITKTHLKGGGDKYVLTPGTFTSLPNFTSGDVVILQQASANSAGGIYYLEGSGFTSNGASVTMDPNTSGGVMLYNAPTNGSNSQGISIAGSASGTVNLSGLTSGIYAGILLWQDRTSNVNMSVTGNGNFSLSGTFYAADANLTVAGNGSVTVGSQYISRTLTVNGNGSINVNYTDNGTARTRIVCLVE